MPRVLRSLLAAGPLLIAAAFQGCAVLPSTVILSESELQRKFDERFPIEDPVSRFGVELTNPIVRLREGTDRVHVSMDAAIALPLVRKFPGTGEISGKVRYDPERLRLYLDDPKIERLDVPGVDVIYEVLFSEMTNLAARFLPSVPLYTLRDDKGFKQAYARKKLSSAEVKNGTLMLKFD
jgi:hypothetical protein